MIDAKTIAFLRFFFTAYPKRSAFAVVLLGIAGILEGVGVVTLIPMLQVAEGGEGDVSPVGAIISSALGVVGLEATLEILLLLLFLMILVKSAFFWVAMMQVRLTMIHVVRNLRMRLLMGLLRARWRFFGVERSGVWANAVSQEAVASGAAFRESCEIIAAVFPIAAYLILAMAISWQTSVFALVSGILLIGALRGFVAVSRRAGKDQAETVKSLAGTTVDVVQGLKPIKAMGREHLIRPIFETEVDELDLALRRTAYAAQNLRFFQEPALTALLAGGILFLFRVSQLPLSTVIVLAFMFYRILQHLNTLQMRYQILVVGEASFWSLMDRIQEAEHEQEALPGGEDPGRLRQEIRLEKVTFAYDERPVLEDLDLTLPAGRFIAILGGSGSGKTTLADLVAGLHRPDVGRVLIDGRDLAELDLNAWRHEIGYVPQEMLLLNDTVRQNVTLGDPTIGDEQVEEALKLAGAWDFVTRMPGGMHAQVGERGALLSGGQRQRIAIARALVTNPSLLILDEVTTALDPNTEKAICDTLRKLAGSVTILSISHQPAMREAADDVHYLENGQLKAVEPSPAL